jgi:archaemetzincin
MCRQKSRILLSTYSAIEMAKCKHEVLQLTPSPFAELAGYTQPSPEERIVATARKDRAKKTALKTNDLVSTFPAPLVLPFDDLNYDPDYEPQDFTDWRQHHTRNRVTESKQTIYIARVPRITEQVKYMHDWTMPNLSSDDDLSRGASSPQVEDFIEYISAFYHGMQVRELPIQLKWTSWYASRKPQLQRSIPKYVALQYGEERTRVRTRSPPDGVFPAQLNLNDILDGAMRILPGDAHAICLLVDHDMWEGDDDDFCCGRAYGGSRVCVVQSARYNPSLDAREGIDRGHMWPLSHCKDFVDKMCLPEDLEPRKPTQRQIREGKAGPMRGAVDAASAWARAAGGEEDGDALWFSRLARTVSHEIAHCFAFDHCVYYACNLQGTAGMKEDVRQPPYLCPVCEVKISHAIAVERFNGSEQGRKTWVKDRCVQLQRFCEKLRKEGKGTAMWSGLEAWLHERLSQI